MEMLITSYRRYAYLKQTLDALSRTKGLDIYVIDGGGAPDISVLLNHYLMMGNISGYAILKNNPGADIARNIGIINFIKGDRFIVSTDDLLPPEREGWLDELDRAFSVLNSHGARRPLISGIVPHYIGKFKRRGLEWINLEGIYYYGVTRADTIGAIVETRAIKEIGLFPVEYGRAGYGTRALCMRFRARGWRTVYLRDFVWNHIGKNEKSDYPKQCEADAKEAAKVVNLANRDALGNKRKKINYPAMLKTIRHRWEGRRG